MMEEIEISQTTDLPKPHKKGISGSTLKLIAIITMVIDHIGASIFIRVLNEMGSAAAGSAMYYLYSTFRIIGRMSFPIFCFLIVEGVIHTHDYKKYLGRLALFAIVSEIPYDLGFYGEFFYNDAQNVFFTLALGATAVCCIRMLEEKTSWHIALRVATAAVVVAVSAGVALLASTDYDCMGVLAIVVIYLLRRYKTVAVGAGCLVLMEIPALISMIPVALYNGERGMKIKWLFYVFYPAHILLLYLIAYGLGVA